MLTTLLLVGTLMMASGGDDLESLFERLQTSKEDAQYLVNLNLDCACFVYPWAAREIPKEQRVAVVETMAKFAKAYTETSSFLEWYEEYRDRNKPQPPEELKPMANERQKQVAEMEITIAELEQQMANAPAEMKAVYREAIDKGRRALKEIQKPDPAQDAMADAYAKEANDKARREYEERVAAWEREFPAKNPRPLIARRLREFLELTQGIDYNAELVTQSGWSFFKKPEYESKPRYWKTAFRAGKAATEKARDLAREWLNQID